jgi:hypothetical protein
MAKLTLWMRVVGVFYLFQFVAMAIVRAPVRTQGPAGTLALAHAGDPLAKFVVDTWLTFGLEVSAIGVALLVLSRRPSQARGVAWTVLGIELMRGLVNDLYMMTRGRRHSVLRDLDRHPLGGDRDRAAGPPRQRDASRRNALPRARRRAVAGDRLSNPVLHQANNTNQEDQSCPST